MTPTIIAHRSNTINDTYKNYYKRDQKIVEIDIQLTKDNKLAVYHDDMSQKRMKQLFNFVGPSLVSLNEFLTHTPDDLEVYLELKNYSNKDYVYRVVHLTKKFPKKKFTYLSFDQKFCHMIKSMKRRAITLIDKPELLDNDKLTDICVHKSLLHDPRLKNIEKVAAYDVKFSEITSLQKSYPFVSTWIVDYED
jgi:glycerophosphoryl diester phosphodiesterase